MVPVLYVLQGGIKIRPGPRSVIRCQRTLAAEGMDSAVPPQPADSQDQQTTMGHALNVQWGSTSLDRARVLV